MAIAVCAVIGVMAGGILLWPKRQVALPEPSKSTPVASVESPREVVTNSYGYLGPDSCAGCHAERVAEFRKTRHFQACVRPEADKMPVGFSEGRGTYIPAESPVRFVMSASGSQFSQTAIMKTPSGEQKVTSPISLVYGCGAGSDEVYFTWRGAQLSELPMSWLHTINDWGTSGFDRQGQGDFSRPTTPRCMECHNTWMEHHPGTLNEYTPYNPILGVTCEVCHGPGREHVTFHEANPEIRTGKNVVHPGRLSRERLMDLCAQCHSNALKHRGPAFNYRPGQPLDESYKTLTTHFPEEDHVANQVTYLKQSRCYQQSGTMTCITCHDPHEPRQPADRGVGESACIKCHQRADCRARNELPNEVQNNCVGCHMSKDEKIQVNFATAKIPYYSPVPRWQHRIAVDPVARDEILLVWHESQKDRNQPEADRLRTALFEHWSAEVDRCKADYRYLAAIHACRQALRWKADSVIQKRLKEFEVIHARLESDRQKLRHLVADSDYDAALSLAKGILELKPNDAKTVGQLGTLFAIKGEKNLAREHWQSVARIDPDDPYGESMLGWQAYLDQQYETAIEAYLRAEQIEPYFDKIQYHLGLALVKSNQWTEAIARFQRVLEINPNHLEGHIALIDAFRHQGEPDQALPVAIRTTMLTKEPNATIEAHKQLADIYADLHQYSDAEKSILRSIGLARVKRPEMVSQLQQKLEGYRLNSEPPKP